MNMDPMDLNDVEEKDPYRIASVVASQVAQRIEERHGRVSGDLMAIVMVFEHPDGRMGYGSTFITSKLLAHALKGPAEKDSAARMIGQEVVNGYKRLVER